MENLVKKLFKFVVVFVAISAVFLATVQGLEPCCVVGNVCDPVVCDHPPCCYSSDWPSIDGSTDPPMPSLGGSVVDQDSRVGISLLALVVPWSPTATIFWTNELNNSTAPVVASFSSRGPTKAAVILKPDLIAPGVNIIASWPATTHISKTLGDSRTSKYNIISGTSMSVPHVSGAAGYIKSMHSTWSPAAVRSALMTTANNQMSLGNNGDTEFGYGAGQIDPIKVGNPGLIYDAYADDYIKFLCSHGYNTTTLQLLTLDNNTCSNTMHTSTRVLNYSSFALKAPSPKQHFNGSFRRTLTNVGLPFSTYRATVTAPEGLTISVNPDVLSFTSLGETKTFVLNVDGAMEEASISTSLIWNYGDFKVRSPIVVYDARAEQDQNTGACTLGLHSCFPTHFVQIAAHWQWSSKGIPIFLKIPLRSPTATIFWTNELNNSTAPVVASFSSRGPTKAAVILKPDLIAPGVNIIAGWPATTHISKTPGDSRKSKYNIISGTSMSVPHLSGAAGYIKSMHSTWSPAAVRSALMTTENNQMSLGNNGDTIPILKP
ncbi:cucumisin [Trifolium repens]|nr:cucumisin [Trifolium repens]